MSDKLVNNLPVVLQTTAVQNFFENTVEQLYSKANTELVKGYIGKRTGADVGLAGAFVNSDNPDRFHYALSPAVNNINSVTGKSENVIFFDEFVDILESYGVTLRNQNTVFASNYQTFMPPINVDKFVNYAEYYWSTTGPTTITITPTVELPINIDRDIAGLTQYTPASDTCTLNSSAFSSIPFRNGMVVKFSGNYVTPVSKQDIEYVVQGVGESIRFVEKNINTNTLYNGYNQESPDYIVIERGATTRSAWSRVNSWYHISNFTDVGDTSPGKVYRAKRPIIEFDYNLEMYNHGSNYRGEVDLLVTENYYADIIGESSFKVDSVDLENDQLIVFYNESSTIKNKIYRVSGVGTNISLTQEGSEFASGDSFNIRFGVNNGGSDLFVKGTNFYFAQQKTKLNEAPLFTLYDDAGNALDNAGLYLNSTFKGNHIFGYQVGTGANDSVLGFPLSYTQFKSASEISFENFIQTANYEYTAFGATTSAPIAGTYYYKLLGNTDQYLSYWKSSSTPSRQKILTTYEINADIVADQTLVYNIGAVPIDSSLTACGYDIIVKLNNVELTTEFSYISGQEIKFNDFIFKNGDVLEIAVCSRIGITDINNSRYEIPLSWQVNPNNSEIEVIAEPQYLSHFKQYIERQIGFEGNPLGINNFDSTAKDVIHALDIVQTEQNLPLAAFLLDDQQHNVIDSLRFVAKEYEKFKARLVKEITDYNNRVDVSEYSNEYLLEKVLLNLTSYSIKKGVFDSTYILPFGDIYTEEMFDVTDVTTFDYTLSAYEDVSKLENTVLVYYTPLNSTEQRLLLLDDDYTISSYSPITITLNSDKFNLTVGDVITSKLYNKNRDSAQCPPTPSSMGLYPLYLPHVETDYSYQEPVDVLVGHDGSRTILKGDITDDLLLEFETRIYNSCQLTLRESNSQPILSSYNVRAGAFRPLTYSNSEYSDLLRNSFINWSKVNKADYIINEFYDANNTWTWNYRGAQDMPGHWRGWFEYYYDTVRPHSHPWEMLGFIEEPTWWQDQYGTDYSSLNTALWTDLELGIIRQGKRANVDYNEYQLSTNVFARPGLSAVLPVNEAGELLSPAEITSTGATTREYVWTNTRKNNLDVTDQFYDSFGTNNLPNGVNITYGAGDSNRITWDSELWDMYSKGWDGFEIANIYVENNNINKTYQLYNYTFDQLGNSAIIVEKETVTTPDLLSNTAIGITVTGVPILNFTSTTSFEDAGEWNENRNYFNETPEYGTYRIEPQHAGLADWATDEHSPIVGWAFDGLPIYGPYGYAEYYANGHVSDNSISSIQSAFVLKSGTRATGPGGAFTGEYIEDYEFSGAYGYTRPNHYNVRYGVTPESPDTPIWFYVATVDANGNPAFPYNIGGIATGTVEYEGKYYSYALAQELNNTGSVNETGILTAVSSSYVINVSTNGTVPPSSNWRFGDGAPVENAWKYSSSYPFAVVESLALAKPGVFATVFADPTNIETPAVERFKIVNKSDRTVWDYRNPLHFRIHGDIDSDNNVIVNSGYTQFIYSWLTFQGLVTKTDFADKLRTVNTKLAHRVEGFTDKDTMVIRSDQFSSTGTTNSLVIPDENITLTVHSSPYKSRNVYSGVIVQKVATGYKVRGYDKNLGYFNILTPNKLGRTSEVEVGGEPVDFVQWEPNTSYNTGTIVSYNNRYWQAEQFVTSSQAFISTLWKPLPSLPQKGAVRGVVYQDSKPTVERVDYETHFSTHQGVFEFLVALGKYQEHIGFSFGEFDNTINDTRNWSYAATQFLFWVAGGWENNNTIELSPMANRVVFEKDQEFVAKINRIERNQFALLDQDGKAIEPTECEIIRVNNRIEIVPPAGQQIYSCLLYTKQIEHAIIVDNVTDFNDTIYAPVYNQKQSRLRVKGKRTANWNGRFSSEGFIIQDDELKPNLDNMAESLGRYHELGFIPVEKQLYEQARGLFGYQERTYLTDLELDDDTQFEFYTGMLHEKGTTPSLSKIAKSNNIIQGTMDVYDEWAFKVGEFGDLENDQRIELKLNQADFVQDPQIVTLAFPEDTTGVVSSINVVSTNHRYYEAPAIEISAPSRAPKEQATAIAHLNNNGELDRIEITNAGSGYDEPVKINVVSTDITVSNVSHVFKSPVAQSSALILTDLSTVTLSTLEITDHFGNANVQIDLSSATSLTDVADIVNSEIDTNASITASVSVFSLIEGTNIVEKGIIRLAGSDFELVENGTTLAGLALDEKRYQPKQRFSVTSFDEKINGTGSATSESNISVTIDGAEVSNADWVYNHGSRSKFTFVLAGIPAYQLIDPTSGTNTPSTTTVYTGDVTITSPYNGVSFSISPDNIIANENVYDHIDVYINGKKLINTPEQQQYEFVNGTSFIIRNVENLPEGKLDAGSNVYVVEQSTVTFDEAYQGDLPGSNLQIKVTSNDNITALTQSKRLYDITPDIKSDEVILIDIDDSERFLKKPLGVKESGLWPTMSNVSFTGIDDTRYTQLPHAGYVNKSNVDYRAFRVQDIDTLFADNILFHPEVNNTIHVAKSENKDWNVYKLKNVTSNVSYVEMNSNDITTYLYSDVDLFEYTDNNQILDNDTGRFLDYHLVIKNTNQNKKFCVWTNQEVVTNKQVRISNLRQRDMLEIGVVSIAPTPNSILEIVDITPAASRVVGASTEPQGNNTVQITTETGTLVDGDEVMIAYGIDSVPGHGNVYAISNVELGRFTIELNASDYTTFSTTDWEGNGNGNIAFNSAFITHYGRTRITTASDHPYGSGRFVKIVDTGVYDGVYRITGATANSFVIQVPFQSSAGTTGNILTQSMIITTDGNHNLDTYKGGIAIHNADNKYYNKVYNVKVAAGNKIHVTDLYPEAVATYYPANAVLTTVDHDTIYPNRNKIKLDNIQSVDGIVEAFNRRQTIMRSWLGYQGSFGMGMLSLNIPNISGITNTAGATPYVTNFNGINTNGLYQNGVINVPQNIAQKIGFNSSATAATPTNITASTSHSSVQPSPITSSVGGKPANSVYNPSTTTTATIASGTSLNNQIFNGTNTVSTPFGAITIPNFAYNTYGQTYLPTACVNVGGGTITPTQTVSIPTVGQTSQTTFTNLLNTVQTATGGGTTSTPTANTGNTGNTGNNCSNQLTFGGYQVCNSANGLAQPTSGMSSVSTQATPAPAAAGNEAAGPVLNPAILATFKSKCSTAQAVSQPQPPEPPAPVADFTLVWAKTTIVEGDLNNLYVATSNVAQGEVVTVQREPNTTKQFASTADIESITDLHTGTTYTWSDWNTGIDLTVRADGNAGPLQFKTIADSTDDGTSGPKDEYLIARLKYNSAIKASGVEAIVLDTSLSPPPVPPRCEKWVRHFETQSTTQSNVNDSFWYQTTCPGTATIVFYMYSAADRIQVYQRSAKFASAGSMLIDTSRSQKASAQEKTNLANGSGSNLLATSLTDYIIDGTKPDHVKFAGKLVFDIDPKQGEWLEVKVTKPSSVYVFYADIPDQQGSPLSALSGSSSSSAGNYNTNTGTIPTNTNTSVTTPIGTSTGTVTISGGGTNKYLSGAYSIGTFKQNFSGWSTHPLTGYRHLPSVFRRNDVKLTNTQNYGKFKPLTNDKYVSLTSQRISGGEIIPLANPVRPPQRLRAKPIRTTTDTGSLLYSLLSNFANGKDYSVIPPRVITITPPETLPISAEQAYSGDFILVDPPQFEVEPLSDVDGYPGVTVDDPNAPANVDVDYNTNPVIFILPKRDVNGVLIPAGRVALTSLYKPTPQITLSPEQFTGVNPGDELVINGTPVTIPGGGYSGFINSLRCTDIPGVTISIPGQGGGFDYNKEATITSCSSAPISFAEGCAGTGRYKELLDFHVVRSFNDGISTANTSVLTTEASYTTNGTAPITVSSYTVVGNSVSISESVTDGVTSTVYPSTPNLANSTTTYNKFNYNAGEMDEVTTQGEIIFNRRTGGSGYTPGDRLRLVGGNPVSEPYGGLLRICIDNGGANYTSGNVQVLIGDGTTPGRGASVSSVSLDPVTNGIREIRLANSGVGYDVRRPPVVTIVNTDPNASVVTAVAHAKVDVATYKVPRVAKFIVTAVDYQGSILGLQIIDRGLYKELPADLDQGLPLEYDYIAEGDFDNGDVIQGRDNDGDGKIAPSGSGLGQWDPLNQYSYLGSPAANKTTIFDPVTGVPVAGFDPRINLFGGGSGARLYFTSRDVPDCSERGTAKSAMGLPDLVINPNYVDALADMFNEGLLGAGYDPDDISFSTTPITTDISMLVLDAPGYDGIEFGELTPGVLDKLGIPIGDYSHGMACMVMTNETSSPDYNPTPAELNNVRDDEGWTISNALPEEIISITCVEGDRMEFPGYTIFSNWADSNQAENFGGNITAQFASDLYQYELRTIFGDPVITPNISQGCEVLFLESQRYATESAIANANVLFPAANIPSSKDSFEKVWIDDVNGKWSYYENGALKRQQTALVDPKYIRDIILYDADTGNREYNLDMWDPFKGVLPAFVDAEIHYISEQDPVVYNSKRARFGAENVGQVWWNTSTIRYNWYEQGSNRERWGNWGSVFPGSTIELYEWVESTEQPLEYTGTGTPKTDREFITERRIDRTTGQYRNYYYYWVQNKQELSTKAKNQYLRKVTTFDLAKFLSDPIRQGLNTISFISSGSQTSANEASFVVSNLPKIMREDEQILQINLSRNLNPIGQKHVSWKLLREGDADSEVPEDLSIKLIDSLCEVDSTGQVVPAPNLSEVEKLGVGFRPRQTMFKDPKEARRVMHYVLNEIFADLKLETVHPLWGEHSSVGRYIVPANWYAVQRVDSLNNKVRYNESYKPTLNVQSVKALDTLKQSGLADGTVVMVRGSKAERYQLWTWSTKTSTFKQIAIENETAYITANVYTDQNNTTLQSDLRLFLLEAKDHLLAGTNLWNKFFFEMVKYAYGEQLQLPWAFKTSYIYVDKEEEDLTQRIGFKPDNFESVVEYMNEVKPFSAKIREYSDGKRTPVEYIQDQMISDFDKPPYPDPVSGGVRILDVNDSDDANILATNGDYVKWYSVYDQDTNPVRTANMKLVFDRVDWRLLEHGFDANVSSYAQGTANMISYLNSVSNSTVASNTNVSMSGRIFKYDPAVRDCFATEIDAYFGTGSSSNTSIITDSAKIETAYLSGALNDTLTLVKEKVGGGFRGEELDANVFTKVVPGEDPLTLQSAFGFDTNAWDSNDNSTMSGWDTSIEVQNFEGVFEGNTTFRRNGVTYEGFDAVTFQRVLYGEERPEEMALFSPLENLIINVHTSTLAFGNGADQPATAAVAIGPYPVTTTNADANSVVTVTTEYQGQLLANSDVLTLVGDSGVIGDFAISNVTQNASNTTFTVEIVGYTADTGVTYQKGDEAVDVEYLVHQNMFGTTEYLRIKGDGTTKTRLKRDFEQWDDVLYVDNPEVLPEPKPGIPGVLWVNNSERIQYRTKNNTTGAISDITRGTRGTTIEKHVQGLTVVSGYYTEVFDDIRNEGSDSRDPDTANWLKADGSTLSLTDVTNRGGSTTIAAFLQGDAISTIGWDSRGWGGYPWDSA